MQVFDYDLVVVGSGIAGLRALLAFLMKSKGEGRAAIVNKAQLMRAHSVAATGGTAAVLRPDEGDSHELHAWDTIKNGEFLSDQDAVFKLVEEIPKEIYFYDHIGLPWSRRPDGKIAQRILSPHSFPRCAFAGGWTGFHMVQTLYDNVNRFSNWDKFEESMALDLIVKGGEIQGVTVWNLVDGDLYLLRAKSVILATGGLGRLFKFTTYSYQTTGDGFAMALRAGLPLKDMEFIQNNETSLVPQGVLIGSAARRYGGRLINSSGERFMERYAPETLEMSPKDVVARAIMNEINQGRGFKGPKGLDYVLLDVTHLPESVKKGILGSIRETVLKLTGLDIVDNPIPVRPAAHFSMGGVKAGLDGQTGTEGLFAAGEVACLSIHGANRALANSTAECSVWGRITGEEAFKRAKIAKKFPDDGQKFAADQEKFINSLLKSRMGTESVYRLREELISVIEDNLRVFRNKKGMLEAWNKIFELKERFKNVALSDSSHFYNLELLSYFELKNMLDLAGAVVESALFRKESRGPHFRTDYPRRDNKNWLRHTIVIMEGDSYKVTTEPVRITYFEPERDVKPIKMYRHKSKDK